MTTLQRLEPTDALTRDEGTLLLYETSVIRLSPLGEEVFSATDRPITLADLADHLAAVFGAPEGGLLEATEEVVHQLELCGVLHRLPT